MLRWCPLSDRHGLTYHRSYDGSATSHRYDTTARSSRKGSTKMAQVIWSLQTHKKPATTPVTQKAVVHGQYVKVWARRQGTLTELAKHICYMALYPSSRKPSATPIRCPMSPMANDLGMLMRFGISPAPGPGRQIPILRAPQRYWHAV